MHGFPFPTVHDSPTIANFDQIIDYEISHVGHFVGKMAK